MTVVDDRRAHTTVHQRSATRTQARDAPSNIDALTSDAHVAADEYRTAMRQVPAAVAVVTTTTPGGRQGLTVTAVSSVSADPPQVLVCINRETRSAEAISAAGRFGVNYLAYEHEELAGAFATPTDNHENRFRLARWVDSPGGTPLLQDALLAFDCTVVNEIHSGTHTIFIGQVTDIRDHDGRPLLYQRGAFTTTEPVSTTEGRPGMDPNRPGPTFWVGLLKSRTTGC